jgi:TatD DNase family protein
LIDSHAHLDDKDFDADREQVLARARQGGVEIIINVGADLESSRRSVALAETHPSIYAAVGVHPHDALSLDTVTLATLRDWAHGPRVVAIGEIGLDYYRDLSPRDAQQAAFERQLDLAEELGLPVVVHDRDAHTDVASILERRGRSPGRLRGVLHCFSGDVELAARVIDWGWYIGVDGPVTFQNARQLPDVIRSVPLSRLLLETDSPYLTPHPYRGRRNEPAHLVWVAEAVAKLKGVSLSELERITSDNARALFGLDTLGSRRKEMN